MTSPSERLTDRKRRDIVDAAIAEFRTRGFEAARVQRIADAAQVSKRTLYKHFETKEALFGAIIDIVLDRIAAIEPVPFDPARPVAAQLTAALEAYIAAITDAGFIDLNRLMTSELLRDEALSRRTFERSEMHNEPVTGLIAAAMQAGKLRQADPSFASIQLVAMIKSFFFWPPFLIGKDLDLGKSPAEIIDDCVTMFVGHYAPIDDQDLPVR